ncbi:MAG: histidine kinase [Ornithinimicrobium sp.]
MLRDAFNDLWDEPAVAAPPGVSRIDRMLVAALVPLCVAEGVLRNDVSQPAYVIVCTLVTVVALLWRSQLPLLMTVVAFTAQTLAGVIPLLAGGGYAVLFVGACILLFPYSLGRWASGRDVILGCSFVLGVHLIRESLYDESLVNIVLGVGFLMLPVALGVVLRLWRISQQRRRSEIALGERERLARELHDVVAHHISGIVIQAQAGQAVALADPPAAVQVLSTIENAAAQTMTEMRSMVGVLREGESAQRAPAPGLGDVDVLVQGYPGSGTAVLHTSGDLARLGSTVEGVIYRLVQESLTNASMHSVGAANVEVGVVREPTSDHVVVSVNDDGEPVARSGRVGFGLIGMRERVEALGGTFEAGRNTDTGWHVRASIPTARLRA